MTDVNNVILLGRATADIAVTYSKSGTAIGNFSIAVNRSVKQADGSWSDKASFINCSCFGKLCEHLQPYLKKGSQVCVQGYLQQDRWESEGQKKSKITVIADQIQLTGKRADNEGTTQYAPSAPANTSFQQKPAFQQPSEIPPESGNGEYQDDIPW